MKRIIVLLGCILICSACARQSIGASFRYKKAMITRCWECNTSTNAFYVSFRSPVQFDRTIAPIGVGQIQNTDDYTLVVTISKAHNERKILKKIIKTVKKVGSE